MAHTTVPLDTTQNVGSTKVGFSLPKQSAYEEMEAEQQELIPSALPIELKRHGMHRAYANVSPI